MSDLPDPLTPPDCDLRDYVWMPVDVMRLLNSETWVTGTPEEKVAAFTLWGVSWHQLPAASLPDNDRMLAHLSGAAKWEKVREHALRGWVKCSDGRWYHPVVAEKARESWEGKLAQKARTEAARLAKKLKKDGSGGGSQSSTTGKVTENVTAIATRRVTTSATNSVTEHVTGSNRTEQTRPEIHIPTSSGDTSPPDARTELWRSGLAVLQALTGRSESQTRTQLGKLLQAVRDDCPALLAILREAESLRPVDPSAWLQAAARTRSSAKASRHDDSVAEMFDVLGIREDAPKPPENRRFLQ